MKKKCLVTGSTGLLGSEAVDFFTEKGWDVVGIDANMRALFFDTPDKVADHLVDIRDELGVNMLFQEHGPFDAIIHAAAQPSHDYSKEHVLEDFHTNATGTLHLLEAARKYSPKAVFVHVSTDKVYGWGMRRPTRNPRTPLSSYLQEFSDRYHSDFPFDEKTPFEPPFSPFGVSKLCSDLYAQEYAAQGWLTTGIFRPGCITGRRHEGAEQHGFLAYLAKCIKEGKTYKIYGYEGKQVRDQIHAYDLVNAFYHFIQKPRSGEVYNIGGGYERAVSPLSASRLISTELLDKGVKPPEVEGLPERFKNDGKEGIVFKFRYVSEPRFGDRQWDVHDVSKFKRDYPEWEYKYSLDDIITDLCS